MNEKNPKQKPDNAEHVMRVTNFVLMWLAKLAAVFRVELAKPTQAAYLEQLSPFPMDRLESAFQRVLREWNEPSKFPLPKFFLDRLENTTLAAEQAWNLVETIRRKFWHPDIGFLPACPEIDAATEYALRQIGGYHRINEATHENLDFVRKGFLQAYQRFNEEGGAQLRLSEGESRKALDTLKQLRAAEQKALPAPALDQRERNDCTRQKGYREMTENEWSSRVDELRQQAKRLQEGA